MNSVEFDLWASSFIEDGVYAHKISEWWNESRFIWSVGAGDFVVVASEVLNGKTNV